MAVSIADMERVALGGNESRFGEDIGNVIELGDLGAGDDLGLSMLMNPSKVSVSRPSDTARTINVQSFAPSPPQQSSSGGYGGGGGGNGGNGGGISFGGPLEPLEALEPITLDAQPIDMNSFGGAPVEVNVRREDASAASSGQQSKGIFGGLFGNSQSATGPGVQLASPARDPEAEKKDKTEYLNKLQRLEAKGFPVARKFTMDNSLEEIKAEYFRLVDARNLETSLKFQRQMLMGAITGMEWLNGRFDPFDLKLDGWSESVHENVEDFDEIFEELYDKYKDRGKMSPEMRLVMAVGGSGFMCHVSNSFFRNKMPSMDDVLRNNPELARQMAAAAAAQAGPGFGNFMGMAMGVQPPQGGQQGQGQGPVQGMPSFPGNGGPFGPAPTGPNPSPVANTGAFFAASAATPMSPGQAESQAPQMLRQTVRRDMTGPSGVGVDDILRTFDEVRRAESAAASIPQMATGFATQPAVAAATQASASVVSADELISQADSSRTGPAGRRGRRRAQAPAVNTIALNV
jgi:Family of unknown function (DUF5767)